MSSPSPPSPSFSSSSSMIECNPDSKQSAHDTMDYYDAISKSMSRSLTSPQHKPPNDKNITHEKKPPKRVYCETTSATNSEPDVEPRKAKRIRLDIAESSEKEEDDLCNDSTTCTTQLLAGTRSDTKQEEPTQTPPPTTLILTVESAWEIIPHPRKVKWGGEDAVFVQGRTFGVFDGVSGCKKVKGMPLYSKTLANEMKRRMECCQISKRSYSIEEMRDLLFTAGRFAKDCATGSTTAVVGSIGEDNILRVLNMGDSAIVVIRDGKVISRTRDTGKSFNVPCQLPFCSPKVTKYTSVLDVKILSGDIIVAGSDGVFDNLSEEHICTLINKSPQTACSIAKTIIDETKRVSRDRKASTPIAKIYKEMGKGDGFGGKKDDMCCVVVQCKQPTICQ